MSRILWSLVLATLILPWALVGAVAHPPEEPAKVAPIPARTLNIITAPVDEEVEPDEDDYNYYYEEDLDLALAEKLSGEPSKVWEYNDGGTIGEFCFTYCSYHILSGELRNTGQDFDVLEAALPGGALHFAWTYSESGIDVAGVNPDEPIGWVYTDLHVGETQYEGPATPLTRAGGDLVVPLEFVEVCGDQETRGYYDCPEAEEGAETAEPADVYAHDVVMNIRIILDGGYDWTSVDWSRHFEFKLDTAGGSFLTVPEHKDPVVVEVPVDDLSSVSDESIDDEIDNVYTFDSEGGDVVFAPGATVPLMLVGTLGLALAMRRRMG